MLKNEPIFTWRIEASGALYYAKLNGFPLAENYNRTSIAYEQPVNDYMRTGKNRLAIYLFPRKADGFGKSTISVSLYVHQNNESAEKKVLIGQIAFDVDDQKNGSGIEKSMPAATLDSKNRMKLSKNGDVVVYEPKIEKAIVRPGGLYIYQDIELETPFPVWGFMAGKPVEYPDTYKEYQDNIPYYDDKLVRPVYDAHSEIFSALQSKDMSRILPFFEERNREMDIAYYEPAGATQKGFAEAIKRELENPNFELKMDELENAEPVVSDDKKLVKLTDSGLIYFATKDESSYHNYEIWMYKKDGKWIVGR